MPITPSDIDNRPTGAAAGRWHLLLAAAVLVCGVVASIWAWRAMAQNAHREADGEFERAAAGVFEHLSLRAQHQLDLLVAFQALFRASSSVSRAEFQAFYDDMRVHERFPALRAIQYSRWVGEAQRPAFEAAVRAEGVPPFAVHPPGPRASYLAVVYSAPPQGTGAALGHDQAFDPEHRAVMETARDSGQPRASGPLVLQQQHPGLVVGVPVYRRDRPTRTVEERRAAHLGQISGELLANDLLSDLQPAAGSLALHVRVVDQGPIDAPPGAAAATEVLVAQTGAPWHAAPTAAAQPSAATRPQDRHQHTMALAGRQWRIEVSRPPAHGSRSLAPLAMLACGLLVSTLLSLSLAWLALQRQRAHDLALAMSAQARANAERLQAVFNSTVDGIVTADHQGRILSVNRALLRLLGHRTESLLGQNLGVLMPRTDAARHGQWMRDHKPGTEPAVIGRNREMLALHADGTLLPIELTVTDMEVNGAQQYVGVLRDLRERRAAQQRFDASARALQSANALREAVFTHAAFALVVTDPQGHIRAMNPAAEKLLGCEATAETGRSLLADFHDDADRLALARELERLAEPMAVGDTADATAPNTARELPLHCLRRDGKRVPVATTLSALRDAEGQVTGLLAISYDATERQRLAEQLSHLAHHDGLTGLANRRLLEQRLQQAIASAQRSHHPLALLFVDLDRFKSINDTYGHAVGDEVLCEVARRLQSVLRSTDLVARLGGDEFVVLLGSLARLDDAPVVADKLLTALAQQIDVGAHQLRVRASIGVAAYPEAGENAAALLRAADVAMYEAKQTGRHTLRRMGLGT